MQKRKFIGTLLRGTAAGILVFFAAHSAFADMVNVGTIDQYGTGFGALTYVLAVHTVGSSPALGWEQGCVGWDGSAVFTGSGACGNYDIAGGEEAGFGKYAGGDEMNPPSFPHNQTPLLGPGTSKKAAGLGITDASQIAVIFNPDQTGPSHPIRLNDLTMTLWDDSTGAMVWQSGDLFSDGDYFPTSDPGVGQSGFVYALDGNQAGELNTFIEAYGGGSFAAGAGQLRLGLSAFVTDQDGGPDSFWVAARASSVPEPSAIPVLGWALVGLAAMGRRRMAR